MVKGDLERYAEEALRTPDHYVYMGDFWESDGWGRMFGVHRDSDALQRSNWTVITEDLCGRFPHETHKESSNHFLVGWADTLRVKVYEDINADPQVFTEAFVAACEWGEKLEDYPVADETHWSNLEWEEFTKYIEEEIPRVWRGISDDDMPEHLMESATRLISESGHGYDPDYLPYKVIEDAVEKAWIDGLIEDATALHPNQLQIEKEN